MALGRRKSERQGELWIATQDIPQTTGHLFYQKVNRLLAEAEFDEYVESLCGPFYAAHLGRPWIPPGVYFRMLFVGCFEGIDSRRGIAWRCADSLSRKSFLGHGLAEATPEHSSERRCPGDGPPSESPRKGRACAGLSACPGLSECQGGRWERAA